ncbi:hypothetical protein LTR66_008007 [Elasticomyces elasticus]|nr:hypothetical protein LTR66_008007 [Elasticomyces elasticus]
MRQTVPTGAIDMTYFLALNTPHLVPGRLTWQKYYGGGRARIGARLGEWDIILTTYHTLVAESKKNVAGSQPVFNSHWRRVVLDEAHDIRDRNSMTAKAVFALNAESRWAVTGTPIQNRLSDLATLYEFLRAYPYDNHKTFSNHIARLWNLRSEGDVVERLKRLVKCITLRRAISTVKLPDRTDRVCRLDFSEDERSTYEAARHETLQRLDDAVAGRSNELPLNVLQYINRLRMICNLGSSARTNLSSRSPPVVVDVGTAWDGTSAQDSFNTLVAIGATQCAACSTEIEALAAEAADVMHARPRLSSCLCLLCGSCHKERLSGTSPLDSACGHVPQHPFASITTMSSSTPTLEPLTKGYAKRPTKIVALMEDLKMHRDAEKSVVFSFWTSTLDIIEAALKEMSIDFIRLDGRVPSKQRSAALKSFHTNHSIRVALLTISCGAVGLDLTPASRAYLMEPHWNPSVEEQALARIYRMGQRLPVITIRYIMRDSFEDHVIKVQNRKQELANLLLSPRRSSSANDQSNRLLQLRSLIA